MPIPKNKKVAQKKSEAPKRSRATGPTHKATWKNLERAVANMFGTDRTPGSGAFSSLTRADTLHDVLFIECKLRANLPLWDLFEDTKAKAKKENKVPLVVIKKKNERGFLFLLRPEDLEAILEQKNGTKSRIIESWKHDKPAKTIG